MAAGLRALAFPMLLGMALCLLLGGCALFRSADDGAAPASAQKIVKTAYGQMGKQYRLGGASPRKGFDCSGLVWWAYRMNGYKVPRVTTEQARAGRAVSKRNARAGDIVVFRTGHSPRGLHTGLYAGGGAFIHSPNRKGRVRVERMDGDSYWGRKLISVRRVVQ